MKILKVLLVVLIISAGFSGCAIIDVTGEIEPKTPVNIAEEKEILPFNSELEFVFSSGVGGWSTVLTLKNDGTFTGVFHDSEMGDMGDGYPNGSYYTCQFNGEFGNIKKVDTETYSMELEEIMTVNKIGNEWIKDGVRHIAAEPYGLEDGKEFLFYMPQKASAGFSEDFLFWWPTKYSVEVIPEKLGAYALHNVEMDYGFFAY